MKRHKVTIFGAGIAGLTAAHELVNRGFDVQVIDSAYNAEYDDSNTLDRGIGGMARSQWSVDPRSDGSGAVLRRLYRGQDLLLDVALDFDEAGKVTDPAHAQRAFDDLKRAYDLLHADGLDDYVIGLSVYGVPDGTSIAADPRVRYVTKELVNRGIDQPVIDQLLSPTPDGPNTRLAFWVRIGAIVPAEHGFRFFPSFYRHLFDTMRRTPITMPTDWQRTRATTYDNLVPCEGLGFARAGHAVSFLIPRHTMSLEQTRSILHQVVQQLGYTEADIARFSLAIFKYMTSCSQRRAGEYEVSSWGDFLESWRYSPISRKHIEYGPQMSAALRGSRSDARTQGNITIQLLMDQLKPDAEADYTLSGPTSSYWLNHWHDFLVHQGVKFVRGALEGFERREGKILPVVSDDVTITGDLFVLALSLPAMKEAAMKFLEVARPLGLDGLGEMQKVLDFAGPLNLGVAEPDGPLQHLSGIQYYFDQDVQFWRGHTQYLDSEWGLTSIAQPQFWSRPRGTSDYYLSLLSVDIGIFDRKYRPKDGGDPVRVWDCTPDQIAKYAWEQIVDGHDDAFKQRYGKDAKIPTPIAYSLDANLRWQDGKLVGNDSPFLVNQTGDYGKRPGRLDRTAKNVSRYEVIAGAYVLAGTFMQTFTRLTSMEGANESARHAVNALLQKLEVPGDRCQIWDPEDNEIDDLAWFKELDAELYSKHRPHFTDILGWDELPDQLEHVRAMAAAFKGGRA